MHLSTEYTSRTTELPGSIVTPCHSTRDLVALAMGWSGSYFYLFFDVDIKLHSQLANHPYGMVSDVENEALSSYFVVGHRSNMYICSVILLSH